MFASRILALLAGIVALTVAAAQDPGYQPRQPQTGSEPEILTRGPVHEAFAVSIVIEPKPGPIAPRRPPEPLDEVAPPQKPEGEDVQWIPGYWFWDDERNDFIWVSGAWRVPPANHQWVPGTWHQVDGQWQWTSGFWVPADATSIEYLPEPPPEPETTPATQAPGEGYTYAPGVWVYQESRYRWRPGYWVPPYEGWVFVPAHYVWTPVGCVFVEGYWDYPLDDRGLLFAPVYISPTVYARRGFVYHPNYVLYDTALLGSLFVRPGYSWYYFGDYFDRRYTSLGYRPWIDYRIGTAVDHNWAYYRNVYATHDRNWVNNMTALYTGRMRGEIPRPARTFAEQANIIARAGGTTTGRADFLHLSAPLQSVDRNVVRLSQVSQADQQRFTATTQQLRQVADQRVKLEAQSFTTGRRQNQPVQLNLPISPVRSSVGDSTSRYPQPGRSDQKSKEQPQPKQPQPPERPDAKKPSTPPPPDRPTTPPTKGAPDRPTTPPTKGAPDRPTTPPTKGAPDRPTAPSPPSKTTEPTPPSKKSEPPSKGTPPPAGKSEQPRPSGPPPRPPLPKRPETVPERPKTPPPQEAKSKSPPQTPTGKSPPPPSKDKDKAKNPPPSR